MLVAEQSTVEVLAGDDFHSRTVHQELLTVGLQHHFQLLFRESRMHEHIGNDSQCLREVFVERIERNESAIGRRRELQPSAVIVQLFGYAGGCHGLCAFTEHAVGKHGLQSLCLMPLAGTNEHIEADNLLRACPNDVQGDAVLQLPAFGACQAERSQRTDGRRCGAV